MQLHSGVENLSQTVLFCQVVHQNEKSHGKIFQDASSLVHSWESICDLQRLHGLLVFCMVTESDDLESLFSSDTEVGLPWVTYEKLVKGFGRVHIVTLPTLLCNPTRNINGWRFF